MALKGPEKEKKNYSKYVGVFTANVVSVNPNKTELEKLLGTTIDKEPEYTGTSDLGNKRLTVSFWLKEEKMGNLFNVRFNLEDVDVLSKTNKYQWINTIGQTSYAEEASQVPAFITDNGRKVRKAKKGEELLYGFLRSWLNDLNYDDPSTELVVDSWKKLISGQVTELRDAISAYESKTIGALATVRTGEDGKEYQGVYSYQFLPAFAVASFSGGKSYKTVDRFIEKITDKEYGCKDYYELKPLVEYDATKNIVQASNSPILNKTEKPKTSKSVTFSDKKAELEMANDDLPF